VTGCAIVYVLTFFVVGVASDFRYAYWCVLATLTGGVAAALPRRRPVATASNDGQDLRLSSPASASAPRM
jgi:hypothetical protein